MNDNTGEIRRLTPEELDQLNCTGDRKGRWYDVSGLSAESIEELQSMSRKDRRAALRKLQKQKG